jgi:hypothetical protein
MFDASPRWAPLVTPSIVRTYVSIPNVTHLNRFHLITMTMFLEDTILSQSLYQ